jgi:NTP pyrophosphatase (non-canonical NTP hydrolase)
MTDGMRCYRDDHALYREVMQARRAAHEKHGADSIEAAPADSPRWLAILVEEIGEVANALTYDGPKENLRAELIDVLAVGSAWAAAIDREAS